MNTKDVARIIVFFGCLTISYIGWSQTNWHVATNGSDNLGDGTLLNPYASLQKAEQQVQAGDTVLVHAGIYRNSGFNDGDIWDGNNLLTITANGTEANPITFMPYNNESVTLEFDGTYGVIIKNSSFINFIGFHVKGISDQITQTEADNAWGLYKDDSGVVHDLAIELGININDPALIDSEIPKPSTPEISKPNYYNGRGIVANSSHHILISENIVSEVPSSAIRCQQSDYVTISKNNVYNNTFWTTQGVGAITVAEATNVVNNGDNGIKINLIKNNVHHNENRLISWNPSKTFVKMVIDEGTGLFLTRNRDTYTTGYILIANNISAFNGASGIVSHFTNRVIIEHNSLFKNGTTNHSSAGGIGINNTDDVVIRNNIVYAEPDHWALGVLANPNTNTSVYNNLLYNENGSETIHKNLANGWVEENPNYLDVTNFDFSLTSNSIAIDAGSNLAIQTEDIQDHLRNDGMPDIGAYEYSVSLNYDNYLEKEFIVYPNPVRDKVHVLAMDRIIESVSVVDLTGKILYSMTRINSPNVTLNLEQLNTGFYVLKISSNGKTSNYKFLKN